MTALLPAMCTVVGALIVAALPLSVLGFDRRLSRGGTS